MMAVQKRALAGALANILACSLAQGADAADDSKRHPVNCNTAPGDLRAIAAEKKHAEDQQLEGVVSILPAGALLGLITGTENKHLKMLSGDYVKELDARAAQIKSTCGI